MTTIDDITLQAPSVYTYDDYTIRIVAKVSSWTIFEQLRELFAKCRAGTVIIDVPGDRPAGFDHTEDSVLTVYVAFTHGNKAKDGWYLLRGFSFSDDPSPYGLSRIVYMDLFYIGSTTYYQELLEAYDLEALSNDWNL